MKLWHHLFKMYKTSSIGLRFFTVYGPYGRPDMSLFKFINSGLNNKKIELYNYGKHTRDLHILMTLLTQFFCFTKKIKNKKSIYKIFNIGNAKPIKLKSFVNYIEKL